MAKEVKFMSVINNNRNWPDNLDFEGLEESTNKIKEILDKMFFEEYPEHPQIFVKLFSDLKFVDTLLTAMVKSGITNLNKIWFRECSEREKHGLMEKGILAPISLMNGVVSLALMRNRQDFFINAIL